MKTHSSITFGGARCRREIAVVSCRLSHPGGGAMDVRCEKCQTEYELDEARLKPGGVTVKCTNCGHMFKIRKRSNTAASGVPAQEPPRAKPPSKPVHNKTAPGGFSRADSMLDEAP